MPFFPGEIIESVAVIKGRGVLIAKHNDSGVSFYWGSHTENRRDAADQEQLLGEFREDTMIGEAVRRVLRPKRYMVYTIDPMSMTMETRDYRAFLKPSEALDFVRTTPLQRKKHWLLHWGIKAIDARER